jgi:hypothetical protein
MQEKTDCWSQWLQRYTYGQTRDRADYAAMRAAALKEVHALPTDEAVMGAAPCGGTPGGLSVNEPSPTSAFTTPPTTIAEVDGGRRVADGGPALPAVSSPPAPVTAQPVTTAAPKDTCVDGCRGAWQTCRGLCKGPACPKCDKAYGSCMRACF